MDEKVRQRANEQTELVIACFNKLKEVNKNPNDYGLMLQLAERIVSASCQSADPLWPLTATGARLLQENSRD